jgi:hypothetical protein
MFGSLDFCQRRLLKLTNLGVLARFRPGRWEGRFTPRARHRVRHSLITC